jgi:hypothetical protein
MALSKHQEKPPIFTADGTTPLTTDADVLAASRKSTRRSFAVAALGAAAGLGFCYWVFDSPPDGMQPWPRRRMFQANAKIAQAVFDERALAPTFARSRAQHLRINGLIGLKQAIALENWRLQVVGVDEPAKFPQYVPDVTAWEYAYGSAKVDEGDHFTSIPAEPTLREGSMIRELAGKRQRGLEEAGESRSTLRRGTPGLLLTVADLLKLPKQELVTEFKCVEGWSQIAQWGGVRMADFLEAYPPARKPDGSFPRYVYMETPNGDYYVGYDMAVCRHPQTLLVTEMGGEPLTQLHGAPLRLHAPTKYGYKQIKRIGLIAYSDVKPDDYWTKLGYDWYAGL